MVSSCPRRLSLVAWPDMSCCRFGPTTSAVFCASPHMRVGDAHGSREPIARSDIALRRCDLLLSKPVSHRPTASGPRGGGGANLYGHAFRCLPVFLGFVWMTHCTTRSSSLCSAGGAAAVSCPNDASALLRGC